VVFIYAEPHHSANPVMSLEALGMSKVPGRANYWYVGLQIKKEEKRRKRNVPKAHRPNTNLNTSLKLKHAYFRHDLGRK